MDYIKWNNAISSFYFSEKKSEKEVFLFITRKDIVKIGESSGIEGDDKEIFNNFIFSIKKDYERVYKFPIIKRPLFWFKKWKRQFDQEEDFPPYIGYLALFILPLTASDSSKYNVDNYYDRLSDYLKKYELLDKDKKISTPQFKKINPLWRDLEKWTIITRNTELGYFELHPFTNERWIYVGKPLSQAIFPVSAINKLHQLYDDIHLVPGGVLREDYVRDIIKEYGEKKLNLDKKVIDFVQKKDNEIGHSIIKLIQRNYENWKGINETEESFSTEIERTFTISELRLCFEIDQLNNAIISFYRLYSQNEYPENLNFGEELPVYYERNNWSKLIQHPYGNKIELIDKYNKWKARSLKKEIRFFVNGKIFHLSGWVEIPKPIPTVKTIAIVKDELRENFKKWEDAFEPKNFRELGYDHPFSGYTIFEFKNPKNEHPNFDILGLTDKRNITLEGGLKLKPNTYLSDALPSIILEGTNSDEIVHLIDENGDKYKAFRNSDELPFFEIPKELSKSNRITISVGEKNGNDREIYIVNNVDYSDAIKEYLITSTDNFGVSKLGRDSVHLDNNRSSSDIGELKFSYKPLTENKGLSSRYELLNYLDDIDNDFLIFYLTYKRKAKFADFFEAYEKLFAKKFKENFDKDINLQLNRRLALRMYYSLGHIELLYNSNTLIVNRPKLALIPTTAGREALLIGGRSKKLIHNLFEKSKKSNLHISISSQPPSLSKFLIPSRVTVRGEEMNVEQNKFRTLARKCTIEFDPDEYLQYSLIKSCANIHDYEKSLKKISNFQDQGFIPRSFDVDHLQFREINLKNIDKDLSLIEYKVNSYTYKVIFWHNKVAYKVDRDWGRFLYLKHKEKQVIFYIDNKKSVRFKTILIPSTIRLPMLFDRALTLLSGYGPESKNLKIREYHTDFTVFKNVPSKVIHEIERKLDQPPLPAKIDNIL